MFRALELRFWDRLIDNQKAQNPAGKCLSSGKGLFDQDRRLTAGLRCLFPFYTRCVIRDVAGDLVKGDQKYNPCHDQNTQPRLLYQSGRPAK